MHSESMTPERVRTYINWRMQKLSILHQMMLINTCVRSVKSWNSVWVMVVVCRPSSLLHWFTVSISTSWRTPHYQTFPAMLSTRRKAGTTNRLNASQPTGFLNGYLSPATHLNVSGAGRIPRPVISVRTGAHRPHCNRHTAKNIVLRLS